MFIGRLIRTARVTEFFDALFSVGASSRAHNQPRNLPHAMLLQALFCTLSNFTLNNMQCNNDTHITAQ